MTYDELNKSIIRMLKSMDEIMKISKTENLSKKRYLSRVEKSFQEKKLSEYDQVESVIYNCSMANSKKFQTKK